jgi:GntR family transcriptional regulator, transcriptional repressor for pyruvate dehydrogenase complex
MSIMEFILLRGGTLKRRKDKAAARVAQEIVWAIYQDGLAPGDHYLSEADALERHNVSRAIWREALRFLEFQGVLRVRAGPGGGAVVCRPDWKHLTSTYALLLQFANAPLSAVMAARTALEPPMAALAVENATDEQIAQMKMELARAKEMIADPEQFLSAYRAFWSILAASTGNAATALLWPALRALIDTGHFVPNERYRAVLLKRISQLIIALEARESERVQELVREHDQEAAQRLQENYPGRIARRIAWSDITLD